MITEQELSEYRNLYTTLGNLHEKFLKKKMELRKLLEETAARRKEAFLVLAKANRLTRYLTGRQRQIAGLTYKLGDITARINQASPLVFNKNLEETGIPMGIPRIPECENHRELKRMAVAVIGMIEHIKKNLLQLDLLEKRCRELMLSINKAMEAFRHESRIIYRKIYPFGIFSSFFRFLRNLFGKTYFTSRDMDDVSALGNITGLVLKIADSTLI